MQPFWVVKLHIDIDPSSHFRTLRHWSVRWTLQAVWTLTLCCISPSVYEPEQCSRCWCPSPSLHPSFPCRIQPLFLSVILHKMKRSLLQTTFKFFIVFQTQQSQFVTWQFETEYRGNDFTAAVTVANPDILRESGDKWQVEWLEPQLMWYNYISV